MGKRLWLDLHFQGHILGLVTRIGLDLVDFGQYPGVKAC